jgi:hypothetical protein
LLKKKPVDQAHESVDHTGPVHHGPAAMAVLKSSPELGLQPLWGSRLPGKGRGWKREARGSRFWAHRGSEGGGGEALGVSSLRAGREGKEGRGTSGGRRGWGEPFYRVRGGAGGRVSERNGHRRWCAIMALKVTVFRVESVGE